MSESVQESDNEGKESDNERQGSDIEWYTLPELDPTSTESNNSSVVSNHSEVDPTELDVLWLRFLSSPLSSSGAEPGAAEENCTCKKVSKPPEHKPKEPPVMFKPFG